MSEGWVKWVGVGGGWVCRYNGWLRTGSANSVMIAYKAGLIYIASPNLATFPLEL